MPAMAFMVMKTACWGKAPIWENVKTKKELAHCTLASQARSSITAALLE